MHDRYMAGRHRWVAPPGWPSPPEGWAPSPGWVPDPSWPSPPENWRWWKRVPRKRAERPVEAVLWTLVVATLCVSSGVYVHEAGVDGRFVGPVMAWLFALLGVCCLTVGIRLRSTAWWTTPAYATTFAIIAGWVLVVLIGPDSGTPGACEPNEACDMDQGLGMVTGPMMLWPVFIIVMLVGRAGAAIVGKVSARPTRGGGSSFIGEHVARS